MKSAAVGLVLFLPISAAFAQGSFTPIPGLPGDNPSGSRSEEISADGSTVVGQVRTAGVWEAMIWTQALGTRAFGVGAFLDVTQDGAIAVGYGPGNTARWSQGAGWQTIPRPPGAAAGGFGAVQAGGVSRDGKFYTGYANTAAIDPRATLWQFGAAASIFLPTHVGGSFVTSMAGGRVSSDGSVVAGSASQGYSQSYRWTASNNTTVYPDSRMGALGDMSPDGNIMVGQTGDVRNCGYIWSTGSGYMDIPDPVGAQDGVAEAVSDDGSVVVGRAGTSLSRMAYIWDPINGTRNLNVVLQSYGVNLQGFNLIEATGISADGRTICGEGLNAQGLEQAWVATIPSPSGASVVILGVVAVGRRRR